MADTENLVIEPSVWEDIRVADGMLTVKSNRKGQVEVDPRDIIAIGEHCWWDHDDWSLPDLIGCLAIVLPSEYAIVEDRTPGFSDLVKLLNQRLGCNLGLAVGTWPGWNNTRGNDTRIIWPSPLRGRPCFSWHSVIKPGLAASLKRRALSPFGWADKDGRISEELCGLMTQASEIRAAGGEPSDVTKNLPMAERPGGHGRRLEKCRRLERPWESLTLGLLILPAVATVSTSIERPGLDPALDAYSLSVFCAVALYISANYIRSTSLFERALRVKGWFGMTQECSLEDIIGWQPARRATRLDLKDGSFAIVPESHVSQTILIGWIEDLRQEPVPQLGTEPIKDGRSNGAQPTA